MDNETLAFKPLECLRLEALKYFTLVTSGQIEQVEIEYACACIPDPSSTALICKNCGEPMSFDEGGTDMEAVETDVSSTTETHQFPEIEVDGVMRLVDRETYWRLFWQQAQYSSRSVGMGGSG